MLGDRRRHPVGLGENNIKADSGSTELGDARDQIGNRGARPRPLPNGLEACLVDIDDDDRKSGLRARPPDLKEVESSQPPVLDRARIEQPQRYQCEQQHQANSPRQTKLPRPAGKSFHDPRLFIDPPIPVPNRA
jgi:hypothetical protein